jgi:type I restriction enzyme S subunit
MEKLLPQLRFPEFKGEWEKKRLGDISLFLDGRRKPIKSDDRNKMKGQYPYYGASGIIDYVNNYIFDEELILLGEDGENIISRNSPLAFRVSGKCWINNHAHVIIPKVGTNIDFLTHNLEKINYVVYNTGTAQPKLNQEVCRSIPSYFPSLPEQTKIATFLTAVDEKLTAFKQKKTLLEQYKKGVMQQIFSQEVSFKDDNGNDFEDWEKKKLAEVADKRIIKNKDNKIKLVFTNSAVQGIVNQRDFFDKDIANKNNLTGYYVIEKNDFIYNPRISSTAPVGPISRNHLDTGIMSPLYSVFRFNMGNLDFIEKFFNSSIWYKHMEDISNYGARDDRMSFSTGDFYKMPIPFPSLEEQIKIANFLSSIDEKINHCQAQIEKATIWKKGLLQQLFV